MLHRSVRAWSVALVLLAALTARGEAVRALFLGDDGIHHPRERFAQIEPVLAQRGIALAYTDRVSDLSADVLGGYDVLVLYANIDEIAPDQERALLEFVSGGGGFVALHSASFCFRNSPQLVALMGAQFERHGWGRVRDVVAGDHAINEGYGGFASWDETYTHHRHNESDRQVLAYREEEGRREPWTWVRWHGEGRVFYTAWGHDHRTWGHPGFHNLVERGIRWSAGREPREAGEFLTDGTFPVPRMTDLPDGLAPFEYVDVGAKIPNYPPSEKWGTQAEPIRRMQKPLAPEESLKRMSVPRGFHVELFAAEPELGGKPIAMAWDARGRLWLAETVDYPNELRPAGEGRDRIRICEDSDGDGRADKFTLFAENLSIPTSIAFAGGAVLVHSGTETLVLRDFDGDDRADERRVLFGEWEMGDTHGGPSNMQYGLDNWIWGMQGYNKSTIATRDAERTFAQGFHRFRTDGAEVEFIRSTNNNTWGLGISEEGIVFGSTANGHPSIYMPIANRYYERVRGWTPRLVLETIADSNKFHPITDKVRQVDHHGGYTAAAGHALYTARTYPREYWNRTAFVCGPTGHLVGTFVLSRDGADFYSTSPFNLLASDDEWSAPIMAEVGPDGNVWVIDWYNFIVQHNPTPEGFVTGKGNAYETDLRDKRHGRIYRVVYDQAKPRGRFNLDGATGAELVAALMNDNLLWRRHAQRLLVERGELDVVPMLIELVADQSRDAIGLNVGAIHALWTLDGLGAYAGKDARGAAVAALRHPSAGVRRNAAQVLPHDDESLTAILESRILADADPQVRLMAMLAVADMPSSGVAAREIVAFLGRAENRSDRWLRDSAIAAAAVHAEHVLPELASMGEPSSEVVEIGGIVAEHLARRGDLFGDSKRLVDLLRRLKEADDKMCGAILAGLHGGARGYRGDSPASELETALEELFEQAGRVNQAAVVRLGGVLGSKITEDRLEAVTSTLLARVSDSEATAAERKAAIGELVDLVAVEASLVDRLLEQVTPQTHPEVAEEILLAIGGSEADGVGAKIVERMAGLSPALRSTGIDVLLRREANAQALLDALSEGGIRFDELSLSQKRGLGEHPRQSIRQRAEQLLERNLAAIDSDRQKVLDELRSAAEETGRADSGKEVFAKHCATCHVHNGLGNKIGPELTGMAVHPKSELLVHILDPSRSVEGNFRQYSVLCADGRILTGMLAGESATAIDLIDAEGKRHAVLREEIEELSSSTKSFMPEGFEKQLTRVELVDLLEFLTARGRYLPLDLRKLATASSARPLFFRGGDGGDRLLLPEWGTKMVREVPFLLLDPQEGRTANVIVLHGPNGDFSGQGPSRIHLNCRTTATAIHLLSGVSGWGFPFGEKGTVSLVVRIEYTSGESEVHPLRNGVHFADYIRRIDVPESEFAFALAERQMRYIKIEPRRNEPIESLSLEKGDDDTAPIIMAVTVETPGGAETPR